MSAIEKVLQPRDRIDNRRMRRKAVGGQLRSEVDDSSVGMPAVERGKTEYGILAM